MLIILRRGVSYLLLLLLVAGHAKAIEATCNRNVFYMPDSGNVLKPYIEVSWQINPATVHYERTDAGFIAKIITSISFYDEQGNVVLNDQYILQTTPADTPVILKQSIVELHRYELPPGKLRFTLDLADKNVQTNIFTYTDSVVVNAPADKPFYSDIQLLDTIINSTQQTVFARNGRQQIPLSFNFLDEQKNRLLFYTELYHSDLIGKEDQPLVQTIFLSRKVNDKRIPDFLQTDTLMPGQILPISGSFPLEALASGNYYLNVKLENAQKSVLASQSVFFQRSNPHPFVKEVKKDTVQKFETVEIFDLEKTFVAKYSIAQLKAILKMLIPIAAPIELDAIGVFLKKPDETYMRYFVYNFWASRDKQNPKKPWDAYTELVKEANKLFMNGAIPGYETDRGVIWLKYGKPNERVVVQNERGVLPYEVWQYNTPGKSSVPGVFLFYRPGYMMNDYRLLHSTVNGEPRNLNWRMQLYTAGGASGSLNWGAEQYIGNK